MVEVVALEDHRRAGAGSAVTVGTFDGVHRGHQAVMAELVRLAEQRGLESTVVTFDRHPAAVVRPGAAPPLLTDFDQRLELLAATGVDRVVVVPFDARRAAQEAEDFVADLLIGQLGARLVLVGTDFRFGRRRRGDVTLLAELGRPAGMEVTHMELVRASGGGAPVSSTAIRALLGAGSVEEAAVLLGRPHELRGPVVTGDGRGGSELGYPTANIGVGPGILVPALGIYAGWFRTPAVAGRVPAAVSIGVRPTFGDASGSQPVTEAHLLDFSGDLYGAPARLQLVSRLRGEEVFDSVGELVAAIGRDVAETRRRLAGA